MEYHHSLHALHLPLHLLRVLLQPLLSFLSSPPQAGSLMQLRYQLPLTKTKSGRQTTEGQPFPGVFLLYLSLRSVTFRFETQPCCI